MLSITSLTGGQLGAADVVELVGLVFVVAFGVVVVHGVVETRVELLVVVWAGVVELLVVTTAEVVELVGAAGVVLLVVAAAEVVELVASAEVVLFVVTSVDEPELVVVTVIVVVSAGALLVVLGEPGVVVELLSPSRSQLSSSLKIELSELDLPYGRITESFKYPVSPLRVAATQSSTSSQRSASSSRSPTSYRTGSPAIL